MLVDRKEARIADPKAAHALGLGMVYQHFTLVPSLTAAENLVISREDAPSVIDWRRERAALQAFMANDAVSGAAGSTGAGTCGG